MNPEDQVFGLGPTLDDSIEYRKAARQPPFRRRRAAVGVCVCVCVCTSYKYFVLCERVGGASKTLGLGDSRWGQFAVSSILNEGKDPQQTHTRIEQVILNVKTRLK